MLCSQCVIEIQLQNTRVFVEQPPQQRDVCVLQTGQVCPSYHREKSAGTRSGILGRNGVNYTDVRNDLRFSWRENCYTGTFPSRHDVLLLLSRYQHGATPIPLSYPHTPKASLKRLPLHPPVLLPSGKSADREGETLNSTQTSSLSMCSSVWRRSGAGDDTQ